MSKPLKCRCDTKPCSGSSCPCAKAGAECHDACHMGRPWESVPCLNTPIGAKVKLLKPAEVRAALCEAGLSPIGDKVELQKRLAVHLKAKGGGGGDAGDDDSKAGGGDADNGKQDSNEALMEVIMSHAGEHTYILSLSGKMVAATSSKAELRKAYLMVSAKVHPDKNPGSQIATKAFQVVVEAFERLANPEKFEDDDDDDDGKPAKKRQKTERVVRGNQNCYETSIQCPKCRDAWKTNDLGLEPGAYNFLMLGIKQYICGGCFTKFGCMTAIHKCPHCKKVFDYDPDDYHRQITCGNDRCKKPFGFFMHKVSERREIEVRQEVKEENEALAKKRAQQKRRNARADNRVEASGGGGDEEMQVKEQLFLLLLVDQCPRCGFEVERGREADMKEAAMEHLKSCNDKKAIAAYQKKIAEDKEKEKRKAKAVETQEDVMAFKTWEHNGRQVGQLWMLSESTIRKECSKLGLSTDGNKPQLIRVLGARIRDQERKMITMGNVTGHVSHDVTPIHKVDAEDLPSNMEGMEREELQCVAASYGVDFDDKADVKMDLVRKLERARLKGSGLLMITDEVEKKKKKGKKRKNESESESDSDFNPSDED